MRSPSGSASRLGVLKPDSRHFVVALSSLLVLAAFWPTLQSFHDVWTRYNYSHGYLAAAVAVWLLWRRKDAFLRLPRAGAGSRGVALASLGALSFVWLVATVTDIQVVHQGVLPLLVLAWVGALSGWRASRRILPAAVAFLFVVPFWEVLVPPLQAMTIAVTGTAVRLSGIDATISGEIITIPDGALQVAGSCAGLGFFVVGLFLATLYAHLFLTRWKTRVAAMAAGAALAVLANWIRVTGLVFVADWTAMRSELLEDHGTYGWVIFFLVFALFVPVARWLERREGLGGADAEAHRSPAASDPEGAGDSARGLRRLAVVASLALLGPVLYAGVGAIPVEGLDEPPESTPGRPGWTALPTAEERQVEWRLDVPMADFVDRTGWTNDSIEVYRDRAVVREQRQGGELVGGSRIAPAGAVVDERTLWLGDPNRWVRQAVLRDPGGVVVIWYWYRVAGIDVVSPGWATVLELWGFLRRRPQAELVALSTLCRADPCREALEGLRAFVRTEW